MRMQRMKQNIYFSQDMTIDDSCTHRKNQTTGQIEIENDCGIRYYNYKGTERQQQTKEKCVEEWNK